MKLEVVIFKKLSEYDLDVCFESHEDRLGLMGPSGSGKKYGFKMYCWNYDTGCRTYCFR